VLIGAESESDTRKANKESFTTGVCFSLNLEDQSEDRFDHDIKQSGEATESLWASLFDLELPSNYELYTLVRRKMS
jgi:hypothetical protein